MFNKRSQKKEKIDDLRLFDKDLPKNLKEMEILNKFFGSKTALIDALEKVFTKYKKILYAKKVLIADLGCGIGDLLEYTKAWADKKDIQCELIGIDANPNVIDYAKNKSVQYKCINILSKELLAFNFDIVFLNNVCHHFTDKELVFLLKNLYQKTKLAIIFNDLERSSVAYYLSKCLFTLFNFSRLAKHDGPLSVLRSFRKKDLIGLCTQANIEHYQIQKKFIFRWQMIIWCDNKETTLT